MQSIGHPILGDDVYGIPLKAPFSFLKGQVLCARKLGFSHPSDGRWIELECALPDDFQKTMSLLRND
jgi:23S rRNA pseudouridine1911/1915/1917 synthase